MRKFKFLNAQSLEEAVLLKQKSGNRTQFLAGGTDLLGQMQDNILPEFPEVVINLKKIPGLDFIQEDKTGLRIGAMTRLEDIARNSLVRKKYPALAEAARRTASPHIREMGTIAGNICQSNRCWYYWSPHNRFKCLRKGGQTCFALFGDGRYHSIFGSVKVHQTPCSADCPASIDIPDYLELFRDGKINEAAAVLLNSNPLPSITGRVCPHFCEPGCNRKWLDEPVSVRALERFLGDYILDNPLAIYTQIPTSSGKKVCIVGSGPAGLSAAFYLRRLGHAVVVFEARSLPGGQLAWGIPPYRLSKDLVKRQIDALRQIGVDFKTNSRLGREIKLEDLAVSFDAVLLACGAGKESLLGIKGEAAILSGIEFLRGINQGGRKAPGRRIAVIGGGNTAIDVARVLRRLGAEAVVIYRRGRAEMPAVTEEVNRAFQEGVEFQFLTQPIEVVKDTSGVVLKCLKIKLAAPDISGRPRPTPITGSEFDLEFDAVLGAFGEEPDLSLLPPELHLNQALKNAASGGRIKDNLFVAGDFTSGASTVVQAIASGRKTAADIDLYLGGSGNTASKPPLEKNRGRFANQFLKFTPRTTTPLISVTGKRVENLETEEVKTLDTGQANLEANRCINCGCVAVNSSDLAPVLIALNASIKTTLRLIPAEQFFPLEGKNSTVLDDSEIVTQVLIPEPARQTRSKFIKNALRKSIDFPVVNCAASVEFEDGKVKTSRICLNAAYYRPHRATAAEKLVEGKRITREIAEAAAAAVTVDALPVVNNHYKIEIARALVKRAILGCNSG